MALHQPRAIVPDKALRPVQNNTGGNLAKFVAVRIDASGLDDPPDVILPLAGGKIYGVIVSSSVREGVAVDVGIEDTKIGDVQIEGRVPILVGAGGIDLGDNCQVTTAGAVIVAAAGDIVIGLALETKAAGEFAEVELTGIQSFITA